MESLANIRQQLSEQPPVFIRHPIFIHGVQFGLLIGLWEILASVFPESLMPTFLETTEIMIELVVSGDATEHLYATFSRVFWAFSIALVLGILIGVGMGTHSYLNKFLTPYVMIALALPGIIWASIIVTSNGFGSISAILIAVIIVTPYTALDIWKGTENIDTELIDMANSFQISRLRTFTRIVLSSIASEIFATFRIGLALTYKIIIVAELFATSNGVGQQLYTAYNSYRFQGAWAWGLLFVLIVVFIEFGIFRQLEQRFFDYREDNSLAQSTHG